MPQDSRTCRRPDFHAHVKPLHPGAQNEQAVSAWHRQGAPVAFHPNNSRNDPPRIDMLRRYCPVALGERHATPILFHESEKTVHDNVTDARDQDDVAGRHEVRRGLLKPDGVSWPDCRRHALAINHHAHVLRTAQLQKRLDQLCPRGARDHRSPYLSTASASTSKRLRPRVPRFTTVSRCQPALGQVTVYTACRYLVRREYASMVRTYRPSR